ncbi:MAG TPA: hypothetical protein VEX39_08585 [Thermoleophilaceae bacterium]|nr:hypothetical protein [Thermoleophilaceae bacterium]
MSELDDLVRELEDAATRLRAGDLEAADAADLVEQCARLAVSIGGELESMGRRAESDPDQEQLL